MYQFKWDHLDIKINNFFENVCKRVEELDPDLLALDTETTGLHIVKHSAFCISFGIANSKTKKAISLSIDIDVHKKEAIKLIKFLIKKVDKIIFWNAKYDLHMLYNRGINLVGNSKVTDAILVYRLANDALVPGEGGISLKLKDAATKFIDKNAKDYQKQIVNCKKNLLITRNNQIKKQTGYKIGELHNFLNDKTNDITDLPPLVQKLLTDQTTDPDNYRNIPWSVLSKYASFDAVFTLELYWLFLPLVGERKQEKVLKVEEQLIPILWNMERVGFKLNKQYLVDTKEKMKNYILSKRKVIQRIVGYNLKVGQHKEIKELLNTRFGLKMKSSDNDSLTNALYTKGISEDAKTLISTIIELRTLEKWYSTYICKWLEHSDLDRIYTSFNQAGAVSGRFSSDFQQFPKEPIHMDNGEELFSTRKIVEVSGNGYDSMVFIDFSSEELRLQALYTILVGHPDTNLCRAFMPFQCKNELGKIFSYKTDLKTYKEHKWYLIEKPSEEWKPTDLHSKTTLTAFPELTEDHPDFKHYRKMGKSTNFAKNYGASADTLVRQFGYEPELAQRLSQAYDDTFPGIKEYKKYVNNILNRQNYVTNLFGRRYYNASPHKCCNYLIQGSGADYLKLKLIELNKFLAPYKSRIQTTIHDEIGYEIYKGEEFLIPQIKAIMENLEGTYVPMVSEVEITTTTWDEKKGWTE